MVAIARDLESDGCRTGLVSMKEPGRSGLPDAGSSLSLGVHRVPVRAKRWSGDLVGQWRDFERGFRSLLDRICPDVVHVNFAVPGIGARICAHRAGVPWVVSTQHELRDSLAPHLRLGLRATDARVNVHVYISNAVAASFRRPARKEARETEHVVIRNGIDIASVERVAERERSAIKGRIIAAGRLVPEKGHATLLRALPQVLSEVPEAHLVVAGTGPEEARLRALAGQLGLAGVVRFEGWLSQEQLWRAYASAEAAAFASDGTQEGFGLALAEAAAAGVPLAVSRIAAFEEVLADDEQAAHWFAPNDVRDVAGALSRALLENDWAARSNMIRRARRCISERACHHKMIAEYRDLYRSFRGSLRERIHE